jgi:hypothetical protein|tara:strand:- start:2014 stop:2289 length:276 start_codon:yes stop_codon:yes gene_type:complete
MNQKEVDMWDEKLARKILDDLPTDAQFDVLYNEYDDRADQDQKVSGLEFINRTQKLLITRIQEIEAKENIEKFNDRIRENQMDEQNVEAVE